MQYFTDACQSLALIVLAMGLARAHRRLSEMRAWIAEHYPEKK